ncbi:hypothetical protein [Desulfurispira natronophila]|uniref:Lipoprotein n=1 Tax=Desulfurispira natronophila TaxID=682562 RepID=A0A7W7Y388_9BACT|nr:hypothetical protein [Desulfurispira natronophila]MBB5021276.1 hypothetical protein [Desulfurispira natronophila]
MKKFVCLLITLGFITTIAGCSGDDTVARAGNDGAELTLRTDKKSIVADGQATATIEVALIERDSSLSEVQSVVLSTSLGEIFDKEGEPLEQLEVSGMQGGNKIFFRSEHAGEALLVAKYGELTAELKLRAEAIEGTKLAHHLFATPAYENLCPELMSCLRLDYYSSSSQIKVFTTGNYTAPDGMELDLYVLDLVLASGTNGEGSADAMRFLDSSASFDSGIIAAGDILVLPQLPSENRVRTITRSATQHDTLYIEHPFTKNFNNEPYFIARQSTVADIYGFEDEEEGEKLLYQGSTSSLKDGQASFAFDYPVERADYGCPDNSGNLPAQQSERVYVVVLSQHSSGLQGFVSEDGEFCFAAP